MIGGRSAHCNFGFSFLVAFVDQWYHIEPQIIRTLSWKKGHVVILVSVFWLLLLISDIMRIGSPCIRKLLKCFSSPQYYLSPKLNSPWSIQIFYSCLPHFNIGSRWIKKKKNVLLFFSKEIMINYVHFLYSVFSQLKHE